MRWTALPEPRRRARDWGAVSLEPYEYFDVYDQVYGLDVFDGSLDWVSAWPWTSNTVKASGLEP
jgi:hypothetical protein